MEFAVVHKIGSVSLFANSVGFLEDTSVNLTCAFMLARDRHHGESLTRSVPVSGKDAVANLAIIADALTTAFL